MFYRNFKLFLLTFFKREPRRPLTFLSPVYLTFLTLVVLWPRLRPIHSSYRTAIVTENKKQTKIVNTVFNMNRQLLTINNCSTFNNNLLTCYCTYNLHIQHYDVCNNYGICTQLILGRPTSVAVKWQKERCQSEQTGNRMSFDISVGLPECTLLALFIRYDLFFFL